MTAHYPLGMATGCSSEKSATLPSVELAFRAADLHCWVGFQEKLALGALLIRSGLPALDWIPQE